MSSIDAVAFGEEETASEAVVTAVANVEGKRPVEVTPPLYDAVDPEALDKLVQNGDGVARVEFTYCGHEIVVDGAGRVSIDDGAH